MTSISIVEKNKEKLNLKPCIDFVARYISNYEEGLNKLLAQPISNESKAFADSKAFNDLEALVEPQLHPEEIKRIISVMPEPLIRLSKLTNVTYERIIPVPIYDKDGNFSRNVELVDHTEFPRPQDHPSRILVGRSNGTGIYLNPIPAIVSNNEEAVKIYQTHVFLHEFLHTIDYPRRNEQLRKAVLLECNGKMFTLQDLWESFERLYLSKGNKPVSRYAGNYSDKLNNAIKTEYPGEFDSAVGEQICESFAGYMLGIISNDDGDVNFKKAHPEEYKLIDSICRANVLKSD